MDLYLIKVGQEKMKVGISKNAEKRIVSIQNTGGYSDNQISTKIFPDSWQYEETLKDLFKDYQIKGEWFEYKGLVEFFHNKVIFENKIDLSMIENFSKKFIDAIDFNFKKENSKIICKQSRFEANKGILSINSAIVNLSASEIEMIKNGELINLYDSFVDFSFGKTFVTWYFEDKRHVVGAFLTKMKVDFRKL